MSSFILAALTAALLSFGPAALADDRVVESGDTLRKIAEEYGLSVSELADANGIDNPDFLRTGQVLHIPVGGKGVKTVTHEVTSGETLRSLAVRYGTTVSAIAEANAISNPDLIRPGWTLTITSGGGSGDGGGGGGGGGSNTYEVRAGDTLGNIANAFGVSSNAILAVNEISNPDVLRIGLKLRIPSGSSPKTNGGGGGGVRCPVPSGSFKNDFGYVKPTGKVHRGIDVYASRGAKVIAPASGTVEQIDGPVGGLQFWLYASDGTRYIGTHLDGFGKSGKVSAGDVIGYVGTSGNAAGTPPHLHFEIAKDGTTISPYPFLVENC